MTREEAINKYIIPTIKNTWNEKKCNEILEALEQEPCEDCISRETARRIVDSGRTKQQMIDMILATPPVTSQPKTGHWIEYTRVLTPEPINEWEQAWYCSECGYGNQECEDGSAWLEWNYCPNCGAKMESEDKI